MILAIAWGGLQGKPPHGQFSLLAAAHRDGVVSCWQVPVVRLGAAGRQDEEHGAAASAASAAAAAPGLAFTLQTRTANITELRWLAMDADQLLVGDGGGCVRMWEASAAGAPATSDSDSGDEANPTSRDVYATADRIKVPTLKKFKKNHN